ncbi:MAG: FAD binding domain-containing protein [Melioribacteraceae bacterium]|nr:FAD binding domain-containing protein [Melioribacteraceae bacterium]MCF8353718.1 FAD binding domain-containing protein [Melioribacteraceae bacterium]MCF8394971.1 FAD binding domain-containing protein [Melioribacteraceae bacterium]MCF8418634.1 FAD binding domain-containing protein [Melioribacteraceae bacterium]
MIPELKILRPEKLIDLLDLIAPADGATRILAGGTDIIPGFHINSKRFSSIRKLVETVKIPEMHEIKEEDDSVIIGSSVTFSELINSELINTYFPLLVKAVSKIGSVQIRNRATIAGNFVNNAPCADSVPPLLVYNAEVEIANKNSTRKVLLNDFLEKPYKTQLKDSECVVRIILKKIDKTFTGDFYKLGRRRGVAISRITLAVILKKENNIIKDIRIASGAVTPIGMRFTELENDLIGKEITPELLVSSSQKLGKNVLDVTGLRWSSVYKVPVIQRTFYNLLENICLD